MWSPFHRYDEKLRAYREHTVSRSGDHHPAQKSSAKVPLNEEAEDFSRPCHETLRLPAGPRTEGSKGPKGLFSGDLLGGS